MYKLNVTDIMWVMFVCCYCFSYVWKIIRVCFQDRLYEDTEILYKYVKYKDILMYTLWRPSPWWDNNIGTVTSDGFTKFWSNSYFCFQRFFVKKHHSHNQFCFTCCCRHSSSYRPQTEAILLSLQSFMKHTDTNQWRKHMVIVELDVLQNW